MQRWCYLNEGPVLIALAIFYSLPRYLMVFEEENVGGFTLIEFLLLCVFCMSVILRLFLANTNRLLDVIW